MLRMGQEKRPFGRYELTSSNNLPSIERGAGQGLVAAGSNDLFSAQGFVSHDVGAHLQFDYKLSDLRFLTLIAGVYNGRGESLSDNNNAKSFGFRGTIGITDKLNVGGSYFSHDNIVTPTGATVPDSNYRNEAFGIDGQWGKPGDPGLYLVADYMAGHDGSGVLVSGDKKKILGVSAIGAYNIRIKSPTSWLYAIEPSIRYDFADPDTDLDENGTTLITAVLGFYMSSRAQFRIGYENESFRLRAPSISGIRTALTMNSKGVHTQSRGEQHGGSCIDRSVDSGGGDRLLPRPASAQQKLTGRVPRSPIRSTANGLMPTTRRPASRSITSRSVPAPASGSSPRGPWTSGLPTGR
jgi:hypothetical protein